jgi:glycosyltransferase involved in cell wall biosynthesis
MTPLISIVIPIFNRADTIGRAIESCLAQTYDRFEIVLVDDCSTDDLPSALQPFAEDQRIRLVGHAVNQGVSAARNTGVQNAKGDLVAFLDSDDAWYPTKLERQVAKAGSLEEDRPYLCGALTEVVSDQAPTRITPTRCKTRDVRFGDYMFVHCVRNRLPLVADSRAAHADGYFIHLSSALLPRPLALATPFRTSLNQYEDLAFLVDIESRGAKVILVEEPLAIQYDDVRPGRLGNRDDVDRGRRFLREMGDALSKDAHLAFETSHLAHLYAKNRPFHTMRIVLSAFSRGLIGPRSVVGILFRSLFGQGGHKSFRDGLSRLRFGQAR